MKYIYTLKDGKRTTQSAKTRSWEKAEAQAAGIRDSWDPVKQKLRELEQQQQEALLKEVSIEGAIEQWQTSLQSDLDNKYTYRKYETTARKILAWAREGDLRRLAEITPDVLDAWKSQWRGNAKRPDDRMGRNTAGRHLEKVKAFTQYCQWMGWTKGNAAYKIRAIKTEQTETLPLLNGRYEQVLQAMYDYDSEMRPDDRYGPELRALFELMRWSGLRISDALTLGRRAIVGNRLSLRPVKLQGRRKLTLVLPDHVITTLQALPARMTVDSDYFFWSKRSEIKSLTGLYQRKVTRLNQFLLLEDHEGVPCGSTRINCATRSQFTICLRGLPCRI